MKKITRIVFLISLVLSFLTNCNMVESKGTKEQEMANKKRILLLGASVGQTWNLKEFPQRSKNDNYIFESVAAWQYDKTEALEEILMRPKRKFRLTKNYIRGFFEPAPQMPDIIIIKECSAYFPGDLKQYKELMEKWVKRIKDANIEVWLATVVPVTTARADKTKGKIEGIREFNDWLREYARYESITLLDLEAALRKDAEARFLKDEFTSGDGTHLNKEAYDILDKVLLDTCQVRLKP